MVVINQVEKKIRMDQWDIVKFQLVYYCYVNKVRVSDHDLSCLALLGIVGEHSIEGLCRIVVGNKIFSSAQSVRNVLSKAQKMGLVSRSPSNKRHIVLNPKLGIQTEGNIVLKYNLIRIEPVKQATYESQESEGSVA